MRKRAEKKRKQVDKMIKKRFNKRERKQINRIRKMRRELKEIK